MGTSYVNISLGHLANHLIYLSSSSSFWFSLNSSNDHDFHLSKRLGVTPEDYEYLLVAADFAHFHKRWGFSINMTKLKLFLEGHRFTTINCDGTFEVDTKKLDLNALMALDLARMDKRWGFSIMVMKWKVFLERYHTVIAMVRLKLIERKWI